jgi:hypothetical protein
MSQNNHKLKKEIVLVKEYNEVYHHIPHICTSWSKSMTFSLSIFALNLQYMQYKYAIILSLPELHINLFRSRMKKEGKIVLWLGKDHTPFSDLRVPFEEYKWCMHIFCWKLLKNSRLLRCENGKLTLLRQLFHFSTTQGYMLANATYPTCVRNALEWFFMLAVCLEMLCSSLLQS